MSKHQISNKMQENTELGRLMQVPRCVIQPLEPRLHKPSNPDCAVLETRVLVMSLHIGPHPTLAPPAKWGKERRPLTSLTLGFQREDKTQRKTQERHT